MFRGVISCTRRIAASRSRELSTFTFKSLSNSGRIALATTSFARRSSRSFSSEGDQNLVKFLKEEVEAEEKIAAEDGREQAQSDVVGFKVKADGAEVRLIRQHGNNETVTVIFNVNDSVDQDEPQQFDDGQGQDESQQTPGQFDSSLMVSRPPFSVEVEKSGAGKKLVFECHIADEGMQEEGGSEEIFAIDQVYVHNAGGSEVSEKVYASSGAVLDTKLYGHLLNFLRQRGIDDEFVVRLIAFSTHYEHEQYIQLLKNISSFVTK